MRLLFPESVVADVAASREWIAEDNPDASERFVSAVRAGCEVLLQHPQLGRPRSFTVPGIRSLLVPGFHNYLIFYRVKGDAVQIVTVVDGRRDLPAALKGR